MLRYKFTPTITSEFKQISPDNDGHVLLPPCVACQLPVQLAHQTSTLDEPSNCNELDIICSVRCVVGFSSPNQTWPLTIYNLIARVFIILLQFNIDLQQ